MRAMLADAAGRDLPGSLAAYPGPVLILAAPDGSVWAMCSQGRLLRATPGDWTWSSALPPGADVEVKSVAFAGGA